MGLHHFTKFNILKVGLVITQYFYISILESLEKI